MAGEHQDTLTAPLRLASAGLGDGGQIRPEGDDVDHEPEYITPEWLAEWQRRNDQSRWPDRGERNDGYLDAMNREIEIAQKASR